MRNEMEAKRHLPRGEQRNGKMPFRWNGEQHGSDSGPPDIATRRQLAMTLMKVIGVVLPISAVNGRSGWRRDAPKGLKKCHTILLVK